MDNYRPGRFEILPLVVKNLLIINGLFFLATYMLDTVYHFDLAEHLGLYYVGSEKFRPYQFISHLFMHGNFTHVFSNMFSLWMFGAMLENFWGPKRFFIYYVVTGLGAAALHSLITAIDLVSLQNAIETYSNSPSVDSFKSFISDNINGYYLTPFNELLNTWASNPNDANITQESIQYANEYLTIKENIPTVGASGAVFGVLLAFGMLFPNTLIYLYFFLPIKAKYFVIFYGLFELYAGFKNDAGDNVAHFAHLGGMLFGFILIKYWNKKRRNDFY